MSIVNIDPLVRGLVETRMVSEDFSLTDLRVETMGGSETTKFLFLVSPSGQRVLRYLLVGDQIHGDNPSPRGDFIVGPSPRRVALQE
jgi:hypothetical protein